MGLALAAELNGYPGPAHSIELADTLGLSPDQLAKLKQLFEAMKAETIPIGSLLIEQERSLNAEFSGKTITPASLEAETQQIGATRARLRAAHLKYHLSTVAILTPGQIAKYNELRGYPGGARSAPATAPYAPLKGIKVRRLAISEPSPKSETQPAHGHR